MNRVLRENTSLGRNGHEGQMTLGCYQATVCTKKLMRIETWNVRTNYVPKREVEKCEEGNGKTKDQCPRPI